MIGHTGVLLPASDALYFVEKVAFQEPYRLLKFKTRTELSDYLMLKYDTEWGRIQPIPSFWKTMYSWMAGAYWIILPKQTDKLLFEEQWRKICLCSFHFATHTCKHSVYSAELLRFQLKSSILFIFCFILSIGFLLYILYNMK